MMNMRRSRLHGAEIVLKPAEFEFEKLRRGILLFNSGEFFKAHEVWEELWLAVSEPDKHFLQGLIQIAAAFHHSARGNLAGTKSLLEAGLKKLGNFPAEYRGVNLIALRQAATRWRKTLATGEKSPPERVPQIEFAGMAKMPPVP